VLEVFDAGGVAFVEDMDVEDMDVEDMDVAVVVAEVADLAVIDVIVSYCHCKLALQVIVGRGDACLPRLFRAAVTNPLVETRSLC
jgi:hypothetical protein